MKKLYVSLPQGDFHGWGICGKNIVKELKKRSDCEIIDLGCEITDNLGNFRFNDPLFVCINDVTLRPWTPFKGSPTIGYCFFEEDLPDEAIENAKHYDLILAGSTWCANKLREKGINHVDVLLQGIDPELFYPLPPKQADGKFTIFSGGKFEYRKGQDIVLAAFKLLQDKYPNLHLVTNWYNHWDFSMDTMAKSEYIKYERIFADNALNLKHICYINGIDSSRVEDVGLVPNDKMRDIFARTDLGVFPNRCEGGTNLVLMEYMTCGKPVLASYEAGQKDILQKDGIFYGLPLISNDPKDSAFWIENCISDLCKNYETEVVSKYMNDNFIWANTVDKLLQYVEIECAKKLGNEMSERW